MKNRKLILTLILAIAIVLLMQAPTLAYQSTWKGNALHSPYNDTWILGIRQMEANGSGMGLNETTLNTNTLLSSTSNNVDIHMQKNTEYGAAIILGASDYGKARKKGNMNAGSTTTSGTDIKASTTGNVYGVYELGQLDKKEFVAARGDYNYFKSVDSRYVNQYTNKSTSARIGDATIETQDWHKENSSWSSWPDRLWTRGGNSTGVFSFDGPSASSSTSFNSRACIVNGAGF